MIGADPAARQRSPVLVRGRRIRLAARARALHPAHCACGSCRNPAEPRATAPRTPISLLCLLGMAASIGLLFLADAIAGGPGLQVMIGQPGKHS
jgi:hypothetical protein